MYLDILFSKRLRCKKMFDLIFTSSGKLVLRIKYKVMKKCIHSVLAPI